MKYTVNVTQEDIIEGQRTLDPHHNGLYRAACCPVARALRRTIPGVSHCSPNSVEVRLTDENDTPTFKRFYFNNQAVTDFIRRADNQYPGNTNGLKPFSFELEVPTFR